MKIKYNKRSAMFGDYWNGTDVSARLNETVEVSEITAKRLLDTGCWIVVEDTQVISSNIKALDGPPVDRMMKEDDTKKKFWAARDKRKKGVR